MLSRALVLKTAEFPPIRKLVTRSPLFRPMVQRFVAGNTAEEAMRVAEGLAERGFGASLDLLGENVATETEARATLDAYLDLVRRIGASPQRDQINISIKLTALGLDLGDEVADRHYRALLQVAQPQRTFVRADMEGSAYTQRTIDLVRRAFADFPETGTVLQSMMRRTLDDVETFIALGARVRLVKGAYLEPEAVAYQEKAVVDSQFIEAGKRLMARGNYPALATHDEAIINTLESYARSEGIPPERYEWQMLYGIRRDLQDALLARGQRVRIYIPFGEAWYPYFSRRLAERPANLAFIARALLRR